MSGCVPSVTVIPTEPATSFEEKSKITGEYSVVPVVSPIGKVKAGVSPVAKDLKKRPVPVATILVEPGRFPAKLAPEGSVISFATSDKTPEFKVKTPFTVVEFERVTMPFAKVLAVVRLVTAAGRFVPVT